MKKTLISICIANYNKWNAIIECLDSIKKYEWSNKIEIVIVDDCSTDNSEEIIKTWIKNNSDINVVFEKNTKNSGPWFTYNHTLNLAHGQYISIIDSDDFLISSSLKEKLEYFNQNPELKIVYWNGTFFENDELNWLSIHKNIFDLFKKCNFIPREIFWKICCKVPTLLYTSCLIEKKFLDRIWWFDEDCFSNDYILSLKIFKNLKSNKEFTIDDKIAFAYRINNNNISKNYDRILLMLKEVLDKYCPDELKNLWYSNIYFTNALSNITIWQYKKAFSSMKTSIHYQFSIKKIVLFLCSCLVPYKLINRIPPKTLQWIKSKILKDFQ